MQVTIGQFKIDIEKGYCSVSFEMGEHDVDMFYSAHGKTAQHFVGINIDQKKLVEIPLPESQSELDDGA